MYLLYPCRTRLEFGYFRRRVERRVRYLIRGKLLAPVVWNKARIGPDRFDDTRRENAFATSRYHLDPLAVVDLVLHRRFRMDLDEGLGTLLDKKTDAPSLIA